jgi:hypothetical protein
MMLGYLHRLVAGPLIIAFSAATALPEAKEASRPTVAKIRQTWTHRSETMGPYALQAELTEQVAIMGRPLSDDPFETRRLGREVNLVTVHKTIAIRKAGAKVRTAVVGKTVDSDNGNVSEQQHHSSFDGRLYKTFGKRADAPFGLGAFGTGETILSLSYKTVEFQAIDWWCDPIVLWKRLPDENVQVNDSDLKLPSSEGVKLQVMEHGRIRSVIIVSKSRPYLPLEFTQYGISGKEDKRCTFVYASDANGQARLMSWHADYFEPDGSIRRKLKGKVTDFSHGKPFDAEELNLRFPVGTHITEYVGERRKRWIQASPTEMKPIKESDYGKLPDGSGKPAS